MAGITKLVNELLTLVYSHDIRRNSKYFGIFRMVIRLKYINYSIGEIISMRKKGNSKPSMEYLYNIVNLYEKKMQQKVEYSIESLRQANPENEMLWINENVDEDIRNYVRLHALNKNYNVLMKSEKKWKTLAEIKNELDIDIELVDSFEEKDEYEEWLKLSLNDRAEGLKKYSTNVFETHAHYNLKVFSKCRDELIKKMNQAGIDKIIIPAIDFSSNWEISEVFDKSEYNFVYYAFASHPKYIWKEMPSALEVNNIWTPDKWEEYKKLIAGNPKYVAIGESGLDYSYEGFCKEHRGWQLEMFEKFISFANDLSLPMILHIRSGDEAEDQYFDAKKDEIDDQYFDAKKDEIDDQYFDAKKDAHSILSDKKIKEGAVLHCFGGTYSDVEDYMAAGVSHFGIGGRITYANNTGLIEAVKRMDESAILLETDSPYMKLDNLRIPNTSLSIGDIAKRVAEIRNTSVEHILEITYLNAMKLFKKACK